MRIPRYGHGIQYDEAKSNDAILFLYPTGYKIKIYPVGYKNYLGKRRWVGRQQVLKT